MGKLLTKIMSGASQSGSALGKIFYVKDDSKRQCRFLTDFEDHIETTWLNCYSNGKNVNMINPEFWGGENPYKDDPDVKVNEFYIWQVVDTEANEVKPFGYKHNQCTPVFSMATMFDTHGTLLDRDYVIHSRNKQIDKRMTLVGLEKRRLPKKYKKLSLKQIQQIYKDAYSNRTEPQKEGVDYSQMKAVELYRLCLEKDIECEKGNKRSYYVELLEDYEEQQVVEKDYFDDDSVPDAPEYIEMPAPSLYKMCVKRGIKCEPKQTREYYADLMTALDEQEREMKDEWSDYQDEWTEDDEWSEDDTEDDEWAEEDDEYSGLPFN